MASQQTDQEPEATVVHFIRHGEVFNPDHIFYGRMPGFHLSETGFREARACGADFAQARKEIAAAHGLVRTSAVLHSPLLRARETAEVLAISHPDHSDLVQLVEADTDLMEVRVPYEGRPLKEMVAMKFEIYLHGREDEGFDIFADVVRRVHRFCDRLRRSPRFRGTQVAAVCHGDICLAARLLSIRGAAAQIAFGPKKNQPSWMTYPDHCSVTSLLLGADGELDQPSWVNMPASLSAAAEEEQCKRQKVASPVGNVESATRA